MEDNLVVKANKLNESRYRLSVQEQRVVLSMLSMIKPGDIDFKPYKFTVKEFAELIGISGQDIYRSVKTVTKNLICRSVIINEPDGDLHIGWISSAKYFDGEGTVELRFDPLLKPYLIALKQEFTRYQLKNTIRLKSSYSVRLYELLKQYQSIGFRFFHIEDLRVILGIPENKLRPFSNFKIRVLDIAQKELKSTDVYFEYQTIKTSRKITGISFTIKNNDVVIEKSYKKKKEKIKEEQLELDLSRVKNDKLNSLLGSLEDLYPKKHEKLLKQAKKRLKIGIKLKSGDKMKIRFKMQDLLISFIEKEKIKI